MLTLKQGFEVVCQHVLDYRPILEAFLSVKDLNSLIHDFYFSEMEFENDIYALCYASRSASVRVARLLMNAKNEYVRRWIRWTGHLVRYEMEINRLAFSNLTPKDFELSCIRNVISIDPLSCSRAWCWYRHECKCGCRLDLNYLASRLGLGGFSARFLVTLSNGEKVMI